MIRRVPLKRILLGRSREDREEWVIEDRVYQLLVNGEPRYRMTIVPQNVVEAGIGRLLGDGTIGSMDEVEGYELGDTTLEIRTSKSPEQRKGRRNPGNISVKEETISVCVKRMVEESRNWKLTGGVHAAALFDGDGEMLYFVEDIGKVSAVDKIIGKALMEGTAFSETMLVSTGRIIGPIVQKTVRAGIPIVVSRSAPIYSSIRVAEEEGVTLVCFARGRRMNVYTHPERIVAS